MIITPPPVTIAIVREGISTPTLPRCTKYGPNPRGCTTLRTAAIVEPKPKGYRGSGRRFIAWNPAIYNAIPTPKPTMPRSPRPNGVYVPKPNDAPRCPNPKQTGCKP